MRGEKASLTKDTKTHHRWSDSPQMIKSRLTIDDQIDSPYTIKTHHPDDQIKTHHRRSRLTTDDQINSPQTIKTHHRWSRLTTDDQIKTHHRWSRLTTDEQSSRPGDKSSSQTSPQSPVSVFSCVPLDYDSGLSGKPSASTTLPSVQIFFFFFFSFFFFIANWRKLFTILPKEIVFCYGGTKWRRGILPVHTSTKKTNLQNRPNPKH